MLSGGRTPSRARAARRARHSRTGCASSCTRPSPTDPPHDVDLAVHLRARRQGEPRRVRRSGTRREQALYWVDINAPSLNRFDPATGAQRRDADARVDRLLRVPRARRLRRRAARRHLARRRRTGRSARKVADAPYDPDAPPLQRRPLRPPGPLLRRRDGREPRRRTPAALWRLDAGPRARRACSTT
ncbi:MAG: SMP-30/gluconolactonase/LRE family protein [Rhodopseudomonas palustris]|nr:SMP-30/gluconolactonase/LRE family protein [Rhodopseudomonas palustris]